MNRVSIRERVDTAWVEIARTRGAVAGLIAREGALGGTRTLSRMMLEQARYPFTVRRRADERFELLGQTLPYTFSRYNNTFRNERSVEISVARWFLGPARVGTMLEIGNVLSHYGIRGHEVLDRYETIRGVINEDVVGFVPEHLYDTVVSISTLEHVGLDETPRDPNRAVVAFADVQDLARPEGSILVTFPIGYNAALDEAIGDGRLSMPTQTVLRRVDSANRWVETTLVDGLESCYGAPFNNANAVYVGIRDPMRFGVQPPGPA